jgi:hypothetical protein
MAAQLQHVYGSVRRCLVALASHFHELFETSACWVQVWFTTVSDEWFRMNSYGLGCVRMAGSTQCEFDEVKTGQGC